MKVYMLQNTDTGLFYKRRAGWKVQDEASIWTTKAGVNAAKGANRARGHNYRVRTFRLVDDE